MNVLFVKQVNPRAVQAAAGIIDARGAGVLASDARCCWLPAVESYANILHCHKSCRHHRPTLTAGWPQS